MITVNIDGKDYDVVWTMRLVLSYGRANKKDVLDGGFEDTCKVFYQALKRGTPDADLTEEQFIEACDLSPELWGALINGMNKFSNRANLEGNENSLEATPSTK